MIQNTENENFEGKKQDVMEYNVHNTLSNSRQKIVSDKIILDSNAFALDKEPLLFDLCLPGTFFNGNTQPYLKMMIDLRKCNIQDRIRFDCIQSSRSNTF